MEYVFRGQHQGCENTKVPAEHLVSSKTTQETISTVNSKMTVSTMTDVGQSDSGQLTARASDGREGAMLGQEPCMTRAALIRNHENEWPTIKRDIQDANQNGLSLAAKAGTRKWNETKAIAWARNNNKLKIPKIPNSLGAIWTALPSTIHQIKG
jgi:hypothetical protein